MFKTNKQKNITTLLLVIYMLLLTWMIVFKFETNFSQLSHWRSLNLIPFYESSIINGRIDLVELIFNIVFFMPLGVFISIYKFDWSFRKKVMIPFIVSFIFEAVQYIFAIGASDITDIINNTLGGVLGIGVYSLFYDAYKEKTVTIINKLASICAVLGMGYFIMLMVI